MAACLVLARWLVLLFLAVSVQSNVIQIFAPNPPNSVNVSDLKLSVVSLINNVKTNIRCVDHGLLPANCNKCLDASRLFELLKLDPHSQIMTLQTAEDLAVLLVHHILYFEDLCADPNPTGCEDFGQCQETVLRTFGWNAHLLESVQKLLRIFKVVLKQDHKAECFNAEQILEISSLSEFATQKEEVRQVLRILMGKIFQGHCIDADESVTDFLDDIFHHYGDSCTPYMSLAGLKQMIHDLQNTGHSHDHDHNHHSHDHSKNSHEHNHHNNCQHPNGLFSLYHSHDHHSHSDNQHSASGGRFTSHKHHDHDDHADHHHDHDHSGHDHDHSGHDHDHSIKHDRLIHSHGDDDSHSSHHVHNEHEHDDHSLDSEHDHERVTQSSMVIQNNSDTIHKEEHDHKEEHPDHVLQSKAEIRNSSTEAEGNKDVASSPVSNISIYNASHTVEDHLVHYESTISIGRTDLLTTTENIDWMLSTAASSAVNSRFQRSASENMESDASKDLTAKSGDFNAPSASLKSDFFHQVERQKEEDETYQQMDDVKKVYLLRNDENEQKTDSTLQLNDKFASLATKCLSAEDLISKFGHQQNSSLTKGDFLELCPALIQQIVSGVCAEPVPPPAPAPSRIEVYGYGSLSVLVISLTSLAGVLLLPVMTKRAYNYIIAGFYGLAFSTLAGDALLHLMPQFLGLHMHGSNGSHDHSHDGSFLEPYTQLQLGVFFTIYGLFLFEAILCAFSSNGHHSSQDNKSHGHSHVHLADQLPTLISVKSKSETQLPVSRDQSSSSLDTEIVEMDSIKKPPNLMVAKPLFCGLTSMALVVTLGDSIHNFGDGLAIGAAFSTGVRGGLSTAIAVFCHELPHEFGDFVVLLSTGLSFSKALVINFLSGLTCFAGLYIGIYIGDNEIARKWIMAVTAGIFLYVALGEMIPELREQGQGSPFKILLVKNLGILSGILIMLLISMYEEEMM